MEAEKLAAATRQRAWAGKARGKAARARCAPQPRGRVAGVALWERCCGIAALSRYCGRRSARSELSRGARIVVAVLSERAVQ